MRQTHLVFTGPGYRKGLGVPWQLPGGFWFCKTRFGWRAGRGAGRAAPLARRVLCSCCWRSAWRARVVRRFARLSVRAVAWPRRRPRAAPRRCCPPRCSGARAPVAPRGGRAAVLAPRFAAPGRAPAARAPVLLSAERARRGPGEAALAGVALPSAGRALERARSSLCLAPRPLPARAACGPAPRRARAAAPPPARSPAAAPPARRRAAPRRPAPGPDRAGPWKKLGHEKRLKAYIVNYADDLVICCRGRADEALVLMRNMMVKLKLTVNESKTRVCRLPEEKFDFLGYTFGRCYSPKTGRAYWGTTPSKKRVQRLCKAISEMTRRSQTQQDAATLDEYSLSN